MLPSGLTFDPTANAIVGTSTAGASTGGNKSDGVYTSSITATDGTYSATTTIIWQVWSAAPYVGIVALPADSGNNALGQFLLVRSGDTSNPLTISYTVSGTAVPDDGSGSGDYQPLSGSVTFAAGQDTATIAINPTTSGQFTDDRTVIVTLTIASDVGVFFFSGYGTKDDDDNFYLVPVDVGRSPKTCVSGEDVKAKLSNMPGRLIAILDACHSGAAAESFQMGRADNLVRDLLNDDCGVVVICASLGEEYALESPATKAGFFTLSLVEGLSGKADFNKDGFVFINEACVYAALRVSQLSRGMQNPTLGRSPNIKPFALTTP